MDLIGRQEQLAFLDQFTSQQPAPSEPQIIVLIGEPGSGKTALINYAFARMSSRRFRLTGQEALQKVSLAAASHMLSMLAGADVLEVPTYDGLGPIQIYERAWRQLSTEDTVVFIDDLQWVDELSMGLIHYLISGSQSYDRALKLVIATRPGSDASAFVDAMERGGVSCIVSHLQALGEPEGTELIRAVRPEVGLPQASEIWRRAGGNPYWMIAISRDPDTRIQGSVLEARLRGASDDTREALSTLAVLGRPVHLPHVAEMLGWERARANAAVGDLEVRGLVGRTEAGRVSMIHDLIREAIVESMSDSVSASAHRRIVDWLEAESEGRETAIESIEHRMAAGLPAVEKALELTRSANRLILGEDGLATLARVADSAIDFDEDLLTELAILASDMGAAEIAMGRWAIVFHQSSDDEIRLWAALQASWEAMSQEEPALARRWLDLANQLPVEHPVLLAERAAVSAQLLMFHEHRREQGAKLAAEAVALSDSFENGDWRGRVWNAGNVRIHALQAQHDALMMAKEHESALAIAEVMAGTAESLPDRLAALINSVMTLRHLGRTEEAAAVGTTVWAEAIRSAQLSVAARIAPWLAGALIELGRLDEGRDVAEEGRHIARRLGMIRSENLSAARSRIIELLTGDWHSALQKVESEIETDEDPHWRLGAREILASYLQLLVPDSSARAIAEMEAAVADALDADCTRCLTDVLVTGGLIAARSGDRDAASRWLERYQELGVVSDAYLDATLDHIGALITEDIEHLERVVAHYEAGGRQMNAIWARFDLARILTRENTVGAASEVLRSVAEDADRIGAVAFRELAEKGLRSLGARTWRRGAGSGTSGLTERESEIALMVASGASNPEIADSLFLSRKTIERHVSNILAKTGARNRTELARKWGAAEPG